jgi:uncharacterized protein HemY
MDVTMIQGPKFRGISYKCGVSLFSEQKWSRAIKELETIPMYNEDEHVCEMLGRCYEELGDTKKAEEMYRNASNIYTERGEKEKGERLAVKVEKVTKKDVK